MLPAEAHISALAVDGAACSPPPESDPRLGGFRPPPRPPRPRPAPGCRVACPPPPSSSPPCACALCLAGLDPPGVASSISSSSSPSPPSPSPSSGAALCAACRFGRGGGGGPAGDPPGDPFGSFCFFGFCERAAGEERGIGELAGARRGQGRWAPASCAGGAGAGRRTPPPGPFRSFRRIPWYLTHAQPLSAFLSGLICGFSSSRRATSERVCGAACPIRRREREGRRGRGTAACPCAPRRAFRLTKREKFEGDSNTFPSNLMLPERTGAEREPNGSRTGSIGRRPGNGSDTEGCSQRERQRGGAPFSIRSAW